MIVLMPFIGFSVSDHAIIAAGIYLFQVSNSKARAINKTCAKLTIKAWERRQFCCSSVSIA